MAVMIESLGRLQFRVPSSKGGEGYIVDLEENGKNGLCHCWDFISRRQPLYDEQKAVVPYGKPKATQCKHLHAVLLHLGAQVVEQARNQMSPHE